MFVKLSLNEISPFLLCALRFLLASVPAIFFIKPPTGAYKTVILYGLIMFGLQFVLLFMGMSFGMPAGMASIIMQTQVFFSMLCAALFLGETPEIWQIIGAMVSFMGIAVIAEHIDSHVTALGVVCILSAAAVWGFGNLITKKSSNINMMSLVIWGSFVASIPMVGLVLLTDGPTQIMFSIHHMTSIGIISLLYTTYISTLVGYGLWNWLLFRYPVGTVAPFTLLIPIVAIMSSILFLGETLTTWKIVAGLLVMSGLFINIFGNRLVFLTATAK